MISHNSILEPESGNFTRHEVPAGTHHLREGTCTDCYMTDIRGSVSLEQHVLAFYTPRVFKLERSILKMAASRPSTDVQAKPPGAGLSIRSIRPFGRSGILEVAIAPLGAAHTYCPDPHSCRYLVAYVNDTVFYCAMGMNTIAFLLSPDFVHKTIRNGGEVVDSIGDDWVAFELFRSDWSELF